MQTLRLTGAVLAAPVLAAALTTPAWAEPRVLVAETVLTQFPQEVPGTARPTGGVRHVDVVEESVTRGGGLDLVNTARYQCLQVRDVRLLCRGEVQGVGSIDGVGTGVLSTRAVVRCELPAFTCTGTTQSRGVSGDLADVRGTGTFTSSPVAGRGTLVFRLVQS